ncbi:molybdopterin cofactor-binding domain-containing protein [Niveispirillum sp. KHB5.9]|uniref:xanthine dehydrogenase family protein molybdopterin-binding subunit n=1 Tax=Niveispirillum sp. KHB5.9 TaxID=3400269 RepID=UPI003A84AFDB
MVMSFHRRSLFRAMGAGLTLGLLPGGVMAVAAPGQGATVNNWLHVGADGAVTLFSNAQEMGQGGFSGVAQLLANELCVAWDKVAVKPAPIIDAMGMAGGTSHWTGGSSSIRSQWDKLRKAGAAARQMLVTAGARMLGVPEGDCRAVDGHVHHSPSGRRIAYGAIADMAARLPVPAEPKLLDRVDWTLVGQPLIRKDIGAKVDGSATYATDIKLPGLLSATLMQCPVFGGRLVSVDPAPALAVPGVRHVVPVKDASIPIPGADRPMVLVDAVVVIADHWWAARQGLLALSPVWDFHGKDDLDTDGMHGIVMARLDDPGSIAKNRREEDEGAIRAAHTAGMATAVKTLTWDYRVPALAHAQMEPMSAVADLSPGQATAWTGSQFPSSVRRILSGLSGLAEDKVTTNILISGGGFGRRYLNDYVGYAAYLSKQVAAPVKLIYSREEDLSQGRYRPATGCRIKVGLDADGMPVAIHTHCAPASGNVWVSMVSPGTAAQPDHQPSYYLPNPLTTMAEVGLPVPNGPWRAPGSTQGAFFFETFVDDLAHALDQDPVAYRRRLLAGNPRALRVLDAAVAASGWGRTLPQGTGLGVAIWNSFQSIAAQVVQVAVDGDKVRVEKVWCAFDCGTMVNPDSVRAQGEGSILMALSASLAEKVELSKGAVTTRNFDLYSLIRMDRIPEMEIIPIESPDAPVGGAGEPMTPPLPPALVNAIFAATGRRLRSLPLTDHGFQVA